MAKDEDDFDVDTYLRLEATSFNQDTEVERILRMQGITRNPLEILDHPPSVYLTLKIEERAIKMAFRKKSLLLHPDKCKHPRAQDSFEILKKAETEVMDKAKHPGLLGFVRDARDTVFRKRNISLASAEEDNPKYPALLADGALIEEIKIEARKMFTEDTTRLQLRMKNEFDRRATEAEEKLTERKRKAEHDKAWEETREERVGSWRNFVKKGGKKKAKKTADEMTLPGMPKPKPPRY
ncbi:hypothetical protein BDZ88DRAFT_402157 [Geranomyces variabilis]|nr:hypothetical protein BDZ88DRAFT_402157 [Geranomyces variabilis]KAJ3142852.1 hypothetical protein HDU90_002723 [Geranomyces variabilis]